MLRALIVILGLLAAGCLTGCDAEDCAAAEDCDDGQPCTEERCRLGVCSHLFRPGCCLTDADCPAGGYACERATATCVPTGAPAGEACAQDADCLGRQCLEEQTSGAPGGVCASPCSAEQPGCAEQGLACVVTLSPFLGGGAYCLPPYGPLAGCRPDWAPLVAVDLVTQQALAVCQPACAPAGCASGVCNEWSGLCNDAPGAGAENGGACAAHGDCRGLCMGFWPGGYCTSPCLASAPDCPAGDVCVDLGVQMCCLDGCGTDADCRQAEGYTCNAAVRVCVPPP
ncbi:MAG TPA: hypothetical protein PK668_09055 [Myxococcota bacterium]|nr:hypothetical protein [Myxococcota bacterium]HRY92872.1 hypothetical protein [Myxococcota bacterium]HSA20760.1 hypothetical protein [Myxococcota bacterium]